MKIERGDILMVELGQIPDTFIKNGVRPVVMAGTAFYAPWK